MCLLQLFDSRFEAAAGRQEHTEVVPARGVVRIACEQLPADEDGVVVPTGFIEHPHQQPLEGGGTQTVWTCEERQLRVSGRYTAEEVQAEFTTWWDYDPTVPEEPDDPETRIMAAFADAIRGGVNGV